MSAATAVTDNPTQAAAQPTGTAVAKRAPTNFEIELAEYEPQIAAVLPDHIKPDHFRRTVITAVNLNPDLVRADRRSLFTSCVQAAQDGLYPDGKEAALVIFNTKVKRGGAEEWIQKVQYMPMVKGIRKLMRNTGEVDSAVAHVVHERDHFDYELGDDEKIEHKPAIGDRGRPIAAYAIIKLANGEIIREVMDVAEIERVRAVSKAAQKGPWVSWWGEMARKTVLRRAAKSAPTSAEVDRTLTRDEDLTGGDVQTPALAPPRPTRATLGAHVTEAETLPGGEDTVEGDVGQETEVSEDGGEPARDVVLGTADTMPATTQANAETADPTTGEVTGSDTTTSTDAFWSRPSYEIEPEPRGKGGKNWPAWIDAFGHRWDGAPSDDAKLKLREDNQRWFDHAKIGIPARWPEIERRLGGKAAA